MTGTTTNQRLAALGGRVGGGPPARRRLLVRRLRRGVRAPVPAARRRRHLHQARRGQAPEQLLGPLRPGRRRPRRGPHLHLLRERGRRRPDQQLARPGRDARRADAAVHRRDEGPHHVRRAVLHGPARLAHRPHRRAAHRLRLRRRQHADHDPHGPGRPRRARRRRVGAVPALGRRARSADGQADVAVAVQRREQVHRPLPRDPRDLVLRLGLRRQRPARQEVLRAAHRLGDGPRRRLAGRAHAHPQAHHPRGRDEVHRRRVPVGVRQDQPGHAHPDHPGLEGRDHRRRHLLDEVRRRRPPLRHQPRGRLLRRRPRHRRGHQPQRHGDPVGQLHLHQRRPHRRRRRVVGGHDRRRRRPASPTGRATTGRPSPSTPAAHPNARFTAPAVAVPVDRPRVGGPRRRADLGDPLRRPPRAPPCRW